MQTRTRIAALVGAVALAAPVALASPATALPTPDARKAASKVVIKGFDVKGVTGPVVFKGVVKSGVKKCRNKRTVKLRQIEAGVNVGKDRTSRSGKWKIRFSQRKVGPGDMRATLKPKTVKVGGKKVRCSGDKHTYKIG